MGVIWSGFGSFVFWVILGLCNGQGDFWRVGSLTLQHRYDCGENGMQLLVFPSHGYDICFKVVDEFGTAFEVSNCSICRHWLTSNDGVVTFSAGYNGCHVLKKDGRHYLKVRVEELTSSRRIVQTHDLVIICPKPQEEVLTQEDNMRLVHLVPQQTGQQQPGPVRPVPQQTGQQQPGPVRPVPQQTGQQQPGPVRPVPQQTGQQQPGPVRPVPQQPGQQQPGPVRPVLQQPGPVRPVPQQTGQQQPGPVRPVLQQPGPVRPVPQQTGQQQPGPVRPVPQQTGQQQQPGPVHIMPQQPRPVRPVPQQLGPQQPRPVRPVPQHPVPQQTGLVQLRPVHPVLQQPGPVQPRPVRPFPQQSPQNFLGSPLTREQCQVSSGKIPCGDALNPSSCSRAGCCYDGRDQSAPCYYGNTVTVQCLQDGHFILVVSRDMLDYPVLLDSVRLSYAQSGCDPVQKTETFLIFRFALTLCGTTVQVMGNRLIYENQLVSGFDILNGPDGSITRDTTFILHTRCIYNATDFLPVQVEVALPPTPAPVLQMGPLRLELRIATDSSYSSYYSDADYPVVKVLRDLVHVEVRILQRMDPSLVLVLHECWATPSANPLEQLQWPILVNGCPFEGDNYRTQLVSVGPATSMLPFPTHYQRFIISTFAFMDSETVNSAPQSVLEGLVYLFCSVSVCHTSQQERCRIPCQVPVASRSRRYLEVNETESLNIVSTHGALIFQVNRQSLERQVKEEKDMASDTDLTLILLVVLPLVGSILFVVVVICKKRRMSKF